MDIERHIKKSNSSRWFAQAGGQKQKNCMHCGRLLENQGTHLWFQGFCSEKCKEDYIEESKMG